MSSPSPNSTIVNKTPTVTQHSFSHQNSSQKQQDQNQRDPAYFQYYSQLMHQQNMLSDYIRTNLYKQVVTSYANECFTDKICMDIGAGSGVLSFFCAQVGAKRVFAIEASEMGEKMKFLIQQSSKEGINKFMSEDVIHVFKDKVENLSQILPNSIDTIISEPIGVFLIHERMLESFVYARDQYLKPGGCIFPTVGSIYLAPFSDINLWSDTMQKARWWLQNDFYGIDFSPFFNTAASEVFSMAVVGGFSPYNLLSNSICKHDVDFRYVTLSDLHQIDIPIKWTISFTGIIHGIASWFDCNFVPSKVDSTQLPEDRELPGAGIILSTHPSLPLTHWQQIRFLFQEPLAVNVGDVVVGYLRAKANNMRSYSIDSAIWLEDSASNGSGIRPNTRRSGQWELQEQTYYYPNTATTPTTAQGQPKAENRTTAMQEQLGIYSTLNDLA